MRERTTNNNKRKKGEHQEKERKGNPGSHKKFYNNERKHLNSMYIYNVYIYIINNK